MTDRRQAFVAHLKGGVLWSTLVVGGLTLGQVWFSSTVTGRSLAFFFGMWIIGGLLYGISTWWFEEERPRRRAAARPDP